ncbi:hypothetical protein [Mycobacterium sp. 20KCMC460]|uniref:hypothetical protein n=1 Tax=Mycobacterium sp. 20KCMC460 TaxID=2903536 RepID=UPI00351D2DD7
MYSVLSADHAPAAANSEPGPAPLVSNVECTSGGDAIHIVYYSSTKHRPKDY